MSDSSDQPVTLRSFTSADAAACKALYLEGRVGGKAAENDTGADIDNIDASYMKRRGNHFWVAVDSNGDVVGMVGVQQNETGTGEVRRLRVRPDCQRHGIGTRLVETAVNYCKDHGCLKLTLDTFMDQGPAIKLFEKFRFRHSRSRMVGEKELLVFYLDLYAGEAKQQ